MGVLTHTQTMLVRHLGLFVCLYFEDCVISYSILETPPGVLHPALQPSAQEGHGPGGAGLEEGHKNDQRAGAPLL